MKIWTSEHTFEHGWETVVTAAARKYPNPHNPSVVGIDVVERQIDSNGVLRSHRLMSTKWGLPDWAARILGTGNCYVSEHSEVDPKKKIMSLKSRNLTFCSHVTIDEHMVYSPHPTDKNKTQLRQEAVVNVHGVPLSSYVEGIVTDGISKNADKGRQAMEWVIDMVKTETLELQNKFRHETAELRREAKEAMDTMDNMIHKQTSV